MQYTVARGVMKMIGEMGRIGQLETAGISEADFELVVGDRPWLVTDRMRVTNAFSALMFSTLDCLGLPRFELPAEYIAAAIAVFVHPVNTHVACRFLEHIQSVQDIGRGVRGDTITAGQLFSLVVQLVGDDERSHARILFERNTGLMLDKFLKERTNNEKKPKA